MDEQIINVLNSLCEKFGIAIDWSSQNILPYLQDLVNRFINYKNITGILWIIISIVLLIAIILVMRKILKSCESWDYSYSEMTQGDVTLLTYIMGGLVSLVFICVVFGNIFGIIKNVYTPELVVIDYVTDTLSTNS